MKTGLLITADMYGCAEKALHPEGLKEALEKCAGENNMGMYLLRIEKEQEEMLKDVAYGIYTFCEEGHVVLHVNSETGYTALDVYSFKENSNPEKLVRDLSAYLDPDKIKITYVERGDFGHKADMKPRRNNRSRSVTRVRNMTKKFGRMVLKPKSL